MTNLIKPQLAEDIASSRSTGYPQGYVKQTRLDVDDLFEIDSNDQNVKG